MQYSQQQTQLQASALQGGPAANPIPSIPAQQPIHQQYLGPVSQQPSLLFGPSNSSVGYSGQPMPRTSSVGNISQAVQPQGGTIGVSAQQVQAIVQQNLPMQQQYPNVSMSQTQLSQAIAMQPQTLPYHDPNQAALQGHSTMDILQQMQQSGVLQTVDDATRIASVLASKPHLHSDLSRTPSPGDQQQGTQKQPQHQQGSSVVQQQQQAPANIMAHQQIPVVSVGQQLSQPTGPQPQQMTSLVTQQQAIDGSSQANLASSESALATSTANHPIAPQVRQVMAMDVRPRAGSEPKTVHHGTKREDSPSKTQRQEQTHGVPHRVHSAVDPHVKRTQSLKERMVSLSASPQEGGVFGNQCTPQASPKPQRRQTVDGAMGSAGIQQSIQTYSNLQSTPVPVVVPQAQQIPSGLQGSLPVSIIGQNGAPYHGMVESGNAALSTGTPVYITHQQQSTPGSAQPLQPQVVASPALVQSQAPGLVQAVPSQGSTTLQTNQPQSANLVHSLAPTGAVQPPQVQQTPQSHSSVPVPQKGIPPQTSANQPPQ